MLILLTKKVDYYCFFAVSFILFHFGQFFLYGLNFKSDYFYVLKYDITLVLDTLKYQFLAVGALFVAAFFGHKIKPVSFVSINKTSDSSIYQIAKIGFAISSLVVIPLTVLRASIYLSSRYLAVISFNESLPSIITIFSYFYVPFGTLAYIYSSTRKQKLFYLIALTFYSFVMTLIGDRTIGLAGIIICIILFTRFGVEKKKAGAITRVILLLFSFLVICALSVVVRDTREGGSFAFSSVANIIGETIYELGFSFFPLVLIMNVCPSNHSFLFGRSYFYSILAGFIPSSIDLTGTVKTWNTYSVEPLKWIETDYDYGFGTGLSLSAESYANFSWFGVIALLVVFVLLIKLFKHSKENRFSIYSSTILLFELFTLPRRNFYYVINNFFYCVVVIGIIILLFGSKKQSSTNLTANRRYGKIKNI